MFIDQQCGQNIFKQSSDYYVIVTIFINVTFSRWIMNSNVQLISTLVNKFFWRKFIVAILHRYESNKKPIVAVVKEGNSNSQHDQNNYTNTNITYPLYFSSVSLLVNSLLWLAYWVQHFWPEQTVKEYHDIILTFCIMTLLCWNFASWHYDDITTINFV